MIWVDVLGYVILLGVISTGLAYLLYNLALEKLEAEICSLIVLIITPLMSILLAVAIIDEELSNHVLMGGFILILAGVYLETHNKKLKTK